VERDLGERSEPGVDELARWRIRALVRVEPDVDVELWRVVALERDEIVAWPR